MWPIAPEPTPPRSGAHRDDAAETGRVPHGARATPRQLPTPADEPAAEEPDLADSGLDGVTSEEVAKDEPVSEEPVSEQPDPSDYGLDEPVLVPEEPVGGEPLPAESVG